MFAPLAGLMSPLGRARARAAAASLPAFDLWLKADALALADGDPVALWPDGSGNANDATAAGAARPTFHTGQINALPAVSFDGSANVMSLTSPVVASGAFTMYAVGHWPGPTAKWGPLGASGGFAYLGTWFDGNVYSIDDGITIDQVMFAGPARDLIFAMTRPNLGTPFTAAATGFPATALNFANPAISTFGCVMGRTGVDTSVGTLGELIACKRALSAGEQTAVQSYLTAKWGLSLP